MPKTFICSSSDPDSIVYNYVEISMDPHLLNNFSNDAGIAAFLTSQEYSEEFQDLRRELLEELMHIINHRLTPKQREIMKLTFLEGRTQKEISTELGRHQSTIHKTIQGNIDYSTVEKKRYGGALKKIKKLCDSNERIQGILIKMKEQFGSTGKR
jgi:DNA-binding NarL/FixJ family response regulator